MMNDELKALWDRPRKPRPVFRSCNIYYKSREFYIISNTDIRDGAIASEPVFHTKELQDLGELVLQSLSSHGHRPDYIYGSDPNYDPDWLMKKLGFGTWSRFTRGTTNIPITQKGEQLIFRIYRPRGGRVLGTIDDPKYTCEVNPESIVKLVADLLKLPNPFEE